MDKILNTISVIGIFIFVVITQNDFWEDVPLIRENPSMILEYSVAYKVAYALSFVAIIFLLTLFVQWLIRVNRKNRVFVGGSAGYNAFILKGYKAIQKEDYNGMIVLEKGRKRIMYIHANQFDNLKLFPKVDKRTFLPKSSFVKIDITEKIRKL